MQKPREMVELNCGRACDRKSADRIDQNYIFMRRQNPSAANMLARYCFDPAATLPFAARQAAIRHGLILEKEDLKTLVRDAIVSASVEEGAGYAHRSPVRRVLLPAAPVPAL